MRGDWYTARCIIHALETGLHVFLFWVLYHVLIEGDRLGPVIRIVWMLRLIIENSCHSYQYLSIACPFRLLQFCFYTNLTNLLRSNQTNMDHVHENRTTSSIQEDQAYSISGAPPHSSQIASPLDR